MGWVDEVRRLRVRTNADTPADARTARAFGAEGIGLCRTEHMFFAPGAHPGGARDDPRRRRGRPARRARQDPADAARRLRSSIFRAMDGLPVTIRLLDPPLHEFLPHTPQEIAEVARELGKPAGRDRRRRSPSCTEPNPMLGHRGCRLAITYPGDLRDPGPGDRRGRACSPRRPAIDGPARDHDPARVGAGRAAPSCASGSRAVFDRVAGRGRGRARRTWSAP